MNHKMIIAVGLILASTLNLSVFAQNNTETTSLSAKTSAPGKICISMYAGINLPTSGDYTSSLKTTDLLKAGPQFNLGLAYYFTKSIGLEFQVGFGWNPFKDEYQYLNKQPVRSELSFQLDGIYSFREMLNNAKIAPFCKLGVGIINWSHLDEGIGGDLLKSPINSGEDFKGTSFAFNVGLGVDYNVKKNLTIGLILDYNMFFPKDEEKFGKDYSEQGFLTPKLNINYFF